MKNEHYVYALIDPINRIPFYIGKGKKDRCFSHLKGYANYNEKKLNYINNIRNLGFEPIIYKIIEDLSNGNSLKCESYLIKYYKEFLTNKDASPPDRTGSKLSESHKEKLKYKNIGKTLTQDHKNKIGLSNNHVPNYKINKKYIDNSTKRNEGSKNPNSKSILCNGIKFGCMKDAYEYFNISKQTFKKRYEFEFLTNL
jgi:hypothetical protein